MKKCHCANGLNFTMNGKDSQKVLPDGESNPALARDRRVYSTDIRSGIFPLPDEGHEHSTTIIQSDKARAALTVPPRLVYRAAP